MKYLFFDLDGTLCESRQLAKPEMITELIRLKQSYEIIIISGAERARIKHQVPVETITMPQNGNELFYNEARIWCNRLLKKGEILKHIKQLAKAFKIKLNKDHIDDRGTQISFSFTGHSASLATKKAFDLDRSKRATLLAKYPFRRAVIGGTTCIDYIPKTKGENIERFIKKYDIPVSECLYIGDAMKGFGNDATVVGVIPTWETKGEYDTLNFIKKL